LRYQQLFAFLPDGYTITDMYGNIRDANQAALALLGKPREFVIGKPLPFFVANEQRMAFYSRLSQIRGLSSDRASCEVALHRRDAKPIFTEVQVTVLSDTDGKPHELLWNFRDISSRKEIEDRLRAERLVMESLIATA